MMGLKRDGPTKQHTEESDPKVNTDGGDERLVEDVVGVALQDGSLTNLGRCIKLLFKKEVVEV